MIKTSKVKKGLCAKLDVIVNIKCIFWECHKQTSKQTKIHVKIIFNVQSAKLFTRQQLCISIFDNYICPFIIPIHS